MIGALNDFKMFEVPYKMVVSKVTKQTGTRQLVMARH